MVDKCLTLQENSKLFSILAELSCAAVSRCCSTPLLALPLLQASLLPPGASTGGRGTERLGWPCECSAFVSHCVSFCWNLSSGVLPAFKLGVFQGLSVL